MILGDLIEQVDFRNSDGAAVELLGVSIDKHFMPSVANVIGTDLTNYKVVTQGRFACNPMHVGRDEVLPIALYSSSGSAIVSPAYFTFEVSSDKALPEYLSLLFGSPEFDRRCWFATDASVRGGLSWDALCNIPINLPSVEEQRRIITQFRAIQDRIAVLRQLNDKLAAMMYGLYESRILSHTSSNLPLNWKNAKLGELCEKIGSGATPRGGKSSYLGGETALIRSMNVFDYHFSYANLAHIADAQAEKLDNVAVKPYDVLLNITGVSVARCCIVPEDVLPARVNQHVMILRAYDQDPHMNFLIMCSLCNQFYKQQLLGISQSGSTREAINKGEMEEFEIAVPDDLVLTEFGQSAQALYQMMQVSLREMNMLSKMKELLLSHLA